METRPVHCRAWDRPPGLGPQVTGCACAGTGASWWTTEESSEAEEVVVEEDGVGDDGEADEAWASAEASASFSKAAAAGENKVVYGQRARAGAGAGRWEWGQVVVSRLAQRFAMGGKGRAFAEFFFKYYFFKSEFKV